MSSTGIVGTSFVLATLGSICLGLRTLRKRVRAGSASRSELAAVSACFALIGAEALLDSGWAANIVPVVFLFLAFCIRLQRDVAIRRPHRVKLVASQPALVLKEASECPI